MTKTTSKKKEIKKPVITKHKKKTRQGIVSSDRQNKTIVVTVTRKIRHKLYNKVIKSSKKYYAHDEKNEAKKGDFVTIIETRPLSKLKRWKLTNIDK